MAKKVKASKSPLIIVFIIVGIVIVFGALYSQRVPEKVDFPTVSQEMGTIIKGFPDFPMYPNAKIESSQITGAYASQPKSFQAYLESTDGVTKIINWYIDQTQKAGWTLDRPVDKTQPDDQNFIVKKGNIKATVNVEQEGATSFISIYIQ